VISALVPTRGSWERLQRNLPSVIDSLTASGEAWEVLVVDDGGGLERAPEGATLISLAANRGYGPAINAGAAAATGDLLLILNDDVRLDPSAVRILRAALPAADIFAVAPAIRSPLARCGDEGGKAAAWRAGLIEIEEAPSDRTHATFYPVGCCFLCHRREFLSLGGYDDVYAPFFFEDVDLGYRAWRRGLATLHVPEAVCHHEGSATIGQRPMDERQEVWHCNWALFHLRNLQQQARRAAAFGALSAQILFQEQPALERGLARALARFEPMGPRHDGGLSDEAILTRVAAR
jgi:GT2 family glycosyltransferase